MTMHRTLALALSLALALTAAVTPVEGDDDCREYFGAPVLVWSRTQLAFVLGYTELIVYSNGRTVLSELAFGSESVQFEIVNVRRVAKLLDDLVALGALEQCDVTPDLISDGGTTSVSIVVDGVYNAWGHNGGTHTTPGLAAAQDVDAAVNAFIQETFDS